MRRLIAGCEMCSVRAACVKAPTSAIVTNASTSISSMPSV